MLGAHDSGCGVVLLVMSVGSTGSVLIAGIGLTARGLAGFGACELWVDFLILGPCPCKFWIDFLILRLAGPNGNPEDCIRDSIAFVDRFGGMLRILVLGV